MSAVTYLLQEFPPGQRGRRRLSAALLVGLVVTITAALATPATAAAATAHAPARDQPRVTPVTRTFHYTGNVQMLDLPASVTRIEVTATGAAGGNGRRYTDATVGGRGTRVHASIPLSGGAKTLYVYVGGAGENGGIAYGGDGGWNGGGSAASASGAAGGGGASEVRTSEGLDSRLAVAGGGGGGGGAGNANVGAGVSQGGPAGEDANRLDGHDGEDILDQFWSCGGRAGQGGTATAGGAGGRDPSLCGAADGHGGGRLTGGQGGFGLLDSGGGGGGGGYFGGGGGAGGAGGTGGGGGGGSSFAVAGATDVSREAVTTGAEVVITYTLPPPVLTCVQRLTLTIGQSLDHLVVLCRTDIHGGEGGITDDGPHVPGTAYFIGPETPTGPLVLVIGTVGSTVLGPVHDYPLTVEAFYTGGQHAIAHVTVSVQARARRAAGARACCACRRPLHAQPGRPAAPGCGT